MRNPAFQKTLLVLALVLGQWLGFAHGFKHAGLATETVCEMCVAAHGLDDALPAATSAFNSVSAAHELPRLVAIHAVAREAAGDPPIRGPPVLLA